MQNFFLLGRRWWSVGCKLPSAFQGVSPTGETAIELAEWGSKTLEGDMSGSWESLNCPFIHVLDVVFHDEQVLRDSCSRAPWLWSYIFKFNINTERSETISLCYYTPNGFESLAKMSHSNALEFPRPWTGQRRINWEASMDYWESHNSMNSF